MKTSNTCSLLLLLFFSAIASAQKELPENIDKNWFNAAASQLHQLQYGFKPVQDKSFIINNTRQRLSFSIDHKGYNVSNKDWNVRFLISNGEHRLVTNKEHEIVYASPYYAVQYLHTENGLRQNFIVAKKPADGLRFAIAVTTALSVNDLQHNSISFSNTEGMQLLYDGLQAWDAGHQPLPASMNWDEKNKCIIIQVDDSKARYPVTIDPLNHSPEWMTSADGVLSGLTTDLQLQSQADYGFTVAGLGDVNGDSFDDVAISAPAMADIWSGNGTLTAAGAVFIYLGSATGLKNTPDKILQPVTAVNGALFGFSIDAGDITGDGKNDIVIGAPLDTYTTTASGIFPASVEVKAGKVYIYRSEDLFSAPNPTPFLELRLQGSTYFSGSLLTSNINLNALFGYSVAVTKSLNPATDNRADIIIGAPGFVGVDLLSVQNGAAFIYYSNDLATTSPAQLQAPDLSLLGIAGLPAIGTKGLLFGFSVDGAGDYDSDGRPDVVVGAPAGVDLSSLAGIFSGQVLGGSAYIFYGQATGLAVSTSAAVKLQASGAGLLSSAANLFGYTVKGVEDRNRNKTGNVLIGAPTGAVTNTIGSLTVKGGQVHLFTKKTTPGTAGTFIPAQTLSSPRSSSVLSILTGQAIQVSLLYGASLDNMLDVNCDTYADIIVGEPLSTAIPLIGADVVGGAVYIYLGKADGTYNTTPYWDLHTEIAPLLGVNTTALLGNSVAGAGYVRGAGSGVRSLVGGPSNALDFGAGLLNLNGTLGTTFSLVAGGNGLGKSYSYGFSNCNITLPLTLLQFSGRLDGASVPLQWVATAENNFSHFELQRSTDGIQYTTMARVPGKGLAENSYAFTDRHPANPMNYYRLKMLDLDGQYSYSAVVPIRFTELLAADLVVSPNPATQQFQLRMNGWDAGNYHIELRNAAGQVLLTKQLRLLGSMQVESIERSPSMKAGIYLITLYSNDNTHRKTQSVRLVLR